MGTLSNSVFQALLGWIRTLSSEIWSTATAPDSATLLRWVGQNWLALTAGLCVFGLIADWMIYLFRWQPYRVWRSFFHRKGRGAAEREDADNPEDADYSEEDPEEPEYAEEVGFRGGYARPAYAAEEYEYPEEEAYLSEQELNSDREPAERMERDAPKRRGFSYAADPEEELRESLENRGRGNVRRENADSRESAGQEGDTVSWHRNEPGGTTAEFDQALRPRRRRRVTRLFSEGNEETVSPDQLIDQYAAYRRPVYPRSWQKEETAEEDNP